MALVLVLYVVAAWWLCFLIAEARLFGCDATGYLDVPELGAFEPEAYTAEMVAYEQWVEETGVIKLRQHLLHYKFFRDLFGCYYCLGSLWVGVPLHYAFRYLFGPKYVLYHHLTAEPARVVLLVVLGCALAGTGAYVLNKAIDRLS